MSGHAILIAGGYGVVGGRIAADLAPQYPDRVVIAGRNPQRANTTAAAIGHGVRDRALDVTVPSAIPAALDDVAVVVNCIDQPRRGLLHAAIQRGLGYTDITPHLVELGRGAAHDHVDQAARASGARVLLGAGLVPGISNVIAAALARTLGGTDTIDTSLLLAADDRTGRASFADFLQELAMPFDVHVDGPDRPARAFSDPRLVEFPAPIGPQRAYLFPFSDRCCIRARWAPARRCRGWRWTLPGWRGCWRCWWAPGPRGWWRKPGSAARSPGSAALARRVRACRSGCALT